MPKKATIYHNPRCSKSRQTLALLEGEGVEPEVIDYLADPPSAEDLKKFCKALGVRPVEIVRSREARFKELGLARDADLTDDAWCAILHENPVLIERPIVVRGRKVAIGRPPENVLEIL